MFVPTDESVEAGANIKAAIEERWKPPKNYFHLRGGGHVAALKSHLSGSSFIHLDIQDFFGSINKTRITRCLKGLFGYAKAREMANASTVIHPEAGGRRYILPFGFVQSPIIASICLCKSALGVYLNKLRTLDRVVVSIYVDDIIISATDERMTADILEEAKRVAERSGFRLNKKKEEGPAGRITAFNIELSNQSLQFNGARWSAFVEAYNKSTNENQKSGIVGYISSVNVSQGQVLVSDG